jgi:hypothetical protein
MIDCAATDQLHLRHTKYRSTNLIADPPYTPRFGDLVAPFPSSDFLYDSETELGRHHFQYRADATVSTNQTLTAAFEYDGERGVLTNHRSTAAPQRPSRNNTGTTVQYEASNEGISLVGGVRFENNGSFGFYIAPRIAASWLVSDGPAGHDALGATRLRGSVGRGIKELCSFSHSPRRASWQPIWPRVARFDSASSSCRIGTALEVIISLTTYDRSAWPSIRSPSTRKDENIGETRASACRRHWVAAGGGLRFSGGHTFRLGRRSISSSPILRRKRPAADRAIPVFAGVAPRVMSSWRSSRRLLPIPTSNFPTIRPMTAMRLNERRGSARRRIGLLSTRVNIANATWTAGPSALVAMCAWHTSEVQWSSDSGHS